MGNGEDENVSKWIIAAAGGFSGLITRLCISPLDVMKIRMQLQRRSANKLKGMEMLNFVKTTLKNEGIFAFWKGNLVGSYYYVGFSAAQFGSFQQLQQILSPVLKDKVLTDTLSGALAGSFSIALLYPLDIMRTKFILQGVGSDKIFTSISEAFQDNYKFEGFRSFYKGLPSALIQIAPYMGIVFGTYGKTRAFLNKDLLLSKDLSSVGAGFISGLLGKSIVYPMDTARRHLQAQDRNTSRYTVDGIVSGRTSWVAIKTIVLREGVKGLYYGVTPSLIKAASSSAISFYSFELFKRILKREAKI